MPTYDYVCTECSHRFEHFQSITSDRLSVCPECEGKLRRLIGGGGALIFKGSGFYETDYKRAKKEPAKTKGGGSDSGGSDSGGSDSGGSDGGGSDSGSGGSGSSGGSSDSGGSSGSSDANSTSAA